MKWRCSVALTFSPVLILVPSHAAARSSLLSHVSRPLFYPYSPARCGDANTLPGPWNKLMSLSPPVPGAGNDIFLPGPSGASPRPEPKKKKKKTTKKIYTRLRLADTAAGFMDLLQRPIRLTEMMVFRSIEFARVRAPGLGLH